VGWPRRRTTLPSPGGVPVPSSRRYWGGWEHRHEDPPLPGMGSAERVCWCRSGGAGVARGTTWPVSPPRPPHPPTIPHPPPPPSSHWPGPRVACLTTRRIPAEEGYTRLHQRLEAFLDQPHQPCEDFYSHVCTTHNSPAHLALSLRVMPPSLMHSASLPPPRRPRPWVPRRKVYSKWDCAVKDWHPVILRTASPYDKILTSS